MDLPSSSEAVGTRARRRRYGTTLSETGLEEPRNGRARSSEKSCFGSSLRTPIRARSLMAASGGPTDGSIRHRATRQKPLASRGHSQLLFSFRLMAEARVVFEPIGTIVIALAGDRSRARVLTAPGSPRRRLGAPSGRLAASEGGGERRMVRPAGPKGCAGPARAGARNQTRSR